MYAARLKVAQLQSDFAATVSHEFRSPLTGIRQLGEMLLAGRAAADEPRRRQYYELICRESDRLTRLVENADFLRDLVRAGGDEDERWADSGIRKSAKVGRKASCSPAATSRSRDSRVLGQVGRRSEAEQIITTMNEIAQRRFVPPSAFALVYAGLGERDTAFRWLEKAYEVRDMGLVLLPSFPLWDSLRSDKRFQDLLRRCRFPA